MRRVLYPIRSCNPISNQEIKGFDVEYELADGSLAKAELRSNRPSWKRIRSIDPDQKPTIRIDTFNHELLKTQTQDHEIVEICIQLL